VTLLEFFAWYAANRRSASSVIQAKIGKMGSADQRDLARLMNVRF
tara:strand:+ start:633 stop:767 length:135 start_codon:yes stop_codon:yes gene_type:complete